MAKGLHGVGSWLRDCRPRPADGEKLLEWCGASKGTGAFPLIGVTLPSLYSSRGPALRSQRRQGDRALDLGVAVCR